MTDSDGVPVWVRVDVALPDLVSVAVILLLLVSETDIVSEGDAVSVTLVDAMMVSEVVPDTITVTVRGLFDAEVVLGVPKAVVVSVTEVVPVVVTDVDPDVLAMDSDGGCDAESVADELAEDVAESLVVVVTEVLPDTDCDSVDDEVSVAVMGTDRTIVWVGVTESAFATLASCVTLADGVLASAELVYMVDDTVNVPVYVLEPVGVTDAEPEAVLAVDEMDSDVDGDTDSLEQGVITGDEEGVFTTEPLINIDWDSVTEVLPVAAVVSKGDACIPTLLSEESDAVTVVEDAAVTVSDTDNVMVCESEELSASADGCAGVAVDADCVVGTSDVDCVSVLNEGGGEVVGDVTNVCEDEAGAGGESRKDTIPVDVVVPGPPPSCVNHADVDGVVD